MPRQGEPLEVLDVDAVPGTGDRLRAAVKRLAAEKAPQSVAQLVLWNVGAGMDWPRLARLSRRWANADELALARRFVSRLNEATAEGADVPRSLDLHLTAVDRQSGSLAGRLRSILEGRSMLGLATRVLTAEARGRSVLACEVRLDREKATVRVLTPGETGTDGQALGDFSIALAAANGTRRAAVEIADALAEGLLNRLVRVRLTSGPRVKGKETYKVRIDNDSPLVLHGLALAGAKSGDEAKPSRLLAISLAPRKSLTVPASAEVVQRLRLKKGVNVLAADLSGL
jgi:hypothetical protein